MISYMISPDLILIRTRSEPDPNLIWTRSEPNLNPIWTRSRPKYINLAKWVTKRNVTRYLVAFWQKIIIKCQIWHFGSLVMLYRAPKLQDFHSVARFGPGYPQKCQFWLFYQFLAKVSQKSGNAFHRVVRFRPGYPQKLRILAFLTNFWQKSGNTSFCDLPTNQDQWNENWRDLNLIWTRPEPTSVYVK